MNTNKNKNASHLTHEMKNEHGGLAEAGMKALITQKVVELNDTRKKQLAEKEIQAEIEEESRKKERESFKRERESLEEEKKLMKKDFKLKEKF
ncbi:hypothetical protein JP0042_08810 [Helicobacter pylori]|nr:hypothetical protein JP0042_08810 [Helicobacter pylori]